MDPGGRGADHRLDVDGRLSVGKLTAARARLSDIQLRLMAKDGQLRLHPASAALYGGSYRGDLRLDARGATPRLALDASLADVQAGPLLKDVLGKEALLGNANAHATLTAQGSESSALLNTLNGKARVNVDHGALKGINLGQLLREAYAKLKHLPPPPKSTEQTDFAVLSASATIAKGVVRNRDLTADAPALHLAGEGTVDLPQRRIDYRLTATLLKDLAGQHPDEGAVLKGLPVPIRITGGFDKPEVALDLKPLLAAKAKQALKQEVKKKRHKAEKKLREKLKGLF